MMRYINAPGDIIISESDKTSDSKNKPNQVLKIGKKSETVIIS
jgi:hypothetical protein